MNGLYKVSNFGRIKRLNYWNGRNFKKGEKILVNSIQKSTSSNNYVRSVVKLYKDKKGKTYKVHRLVAEAFIENPSKFNVINHLDGNPLNNMVDNLEWCTQKHNISNAFNNDNCCKTINGIDRETIVELLNNNYNYDDIAQMLGIAKGTVFNYIKKFKIKKLYI